ncbi:hypothetical protein KAFR_0A06480 [Kazachstania africana CBS 2517]|uniref:CDC20/Fizzy WD40 domain-containing protein n=1 Tax=Kazachstania africana (strain ATCC 22294 / BCRC 22015 / CBS 2517 / CECT 1963 / NBRC 1671 / NRRL Y-8276) TaxID=1071382 RepID=H2ANY3_KAZAF|nr:hypothetical protein KAFR_0A06480 [Kazachstania africana CBS 2517]CCF56083.1 hypothetical protein KAFR_0A06480 [Kazachstania africana CBS 2517]
MLDNPFMSNTPSASPLKGHNTKRINEKYSTNTSLFSSSSASSGSANSILLASPTRRPRTTNTDYTDRFLPSRTSINLNSINSIANSTNSSFTNSNVNSEDQVELQRERQANETFDTVLKNEIFGELLSKDLNDKESNIDKIKHTKTTILSTPLSPPQKEANDSDLLSSPVTPKRLFTIGTNSSNTDELYRPSSNSMRGVSLLTYRSSPKKTRPSTTTLLNSQFFDSISSMRPESKQLLLSPKKTYRKIAKIPYRVLDAPSLADDFYYDLIDWSSTDLLAVALGKSIFLTNNSNGEVIHLCDTENEYTSLNWVGSGSHLAVGQSNGIVEIFDVNKKKCIRTMLGHSDRVACLSWNSYILTSGSRDHNILHRDVRSPDPFFEKIESHSQEVCGLKWNVDENKLVSGGNDNIVNVYDRTSTKPFMTMTEHKAAVKALDWSSHKRGILATGGGTADRHLKIWNVNNMTKLNDVDTGSQVCNLVWSKNTDEIVTSHGFSKYNLTLWNYPNLDPIAILKGHSFRVLHLTLSADGTTIVSGAGDETLRYWKLFEKQKHRSLSDTSSMFNAFNKIR